MKSTPHEYILNIVEMTTKDLKYYINLVDEIVTSFERIDCKFKSSTVDKMLPNSIAYYRKIIHGRKSVDEANFIIVLC